jgi:hypothetical protein
VGERVVRHGRRWRGRAHRDRKGHLELWAFLSRGELEERALVASAAGPEPAGADRSAVITGNMRVISFRAAQASCHGSRDTASARSASSRGAHGERRPHQWHVPSSRTT